MLKILQNEKGLSLLEIVVMIFLLSIIAIALSTMTIFSFALLERSDHTTEIAYVGKRIMDDLKSINTANLHHYDGYDSRDEETLPENEEARDNCLLWKDWVENFHPEARYTISIQENPGARLTLFNINLTFFWKEHRQETETKTTLSAIRTSGADN